MVRQEGGQIRRYCHIGTGNYNPKTARLYEDIGVLTADPTIGADLTDLFNSLTGYSRQTSYRSLLVAPYGVRRGIVRRIEDEIEAHREGKDDARDPDQGQLARRRAGDRRAVPGVAGRGAGGHRRARDLRDPARAARGSRENIHVRSILGRFLEHSPDLPLRRGGRLLDRQRRHDAPQPRPARRGAAAGGRRSPSPRGWATVLDSCLDPATRCWTLWARRRVVAVAVTGLGGVAGARPPGRDDACTRDGAVPAAEAE